MSPPHTILIVQLLHQGRGFFMGNKNPRSNLRAECKYILLSMRFQETDMLAYYNVLQLGGTHRYHPCVKISKTPCTSGLIGVVATWLS